MTGITVNADIDTIDGSVGLTNRVRGPRPADRKRDGGPRTVREGET